jgi:hypothetical protein
MFLSQVNHAGFSSVQEEKTWTDNDDFSYDYVSAANKGATLQELHNIAETFLASPDFDPNYDEGFFLTMAARKNHVWLLSELIQRGADVGKWGVDAVLGAARYGAIESIELLYEHGADVRLLYHSLAAGGYPAIQRFVERVFATPAQSISDCINSRY